ncbi:MAG: substrate-binding domain-containing protein [Candidatus Odinarchaeia archaeon]
MPQLSPTQTKALIILAIVVIGGAGTAFAIIESSSSSQRLIIATTTSTYDSGLLDYLIPTFEAKWGIQVDVISVGTGQAIATAQSGDADLILVHDRTTEDNFVYEGYGIHRVTIMYNDFIIVGPESDPANINGLTNVTEAFIRIYNAGQNGLCAFYSRGDGSGTHARELRIWNATGLDTPTNTSWYKETGSGMGQTLTITNEEGGYTLSDRGTWLSYKDELSLVILVENDSMLLNPYGAILVDPGRFPNVNFQAAVKFIAFLVSTEGQTMINNFKKNGEQLFIACFGTSNQSSLQFDTDEQVQEQWNYWHPLAVQYYGG